MQSPQIETGTSIFREAHLRDYWKVVWQARWTILAIFVVVVGLTAVWTFLQTPIYSATAVVEVQPQANRLAAGQDISGLGVAGYGWFAEEKYHNTQVEIIQSRDVAKRVVDALDLGSHPRFANSADPIESFRRSIRAIPRRDTGLIEISISGTNPAEIQEWVNAVADAFVHRNLEKAEEKVRTALTTIQEQMSEMSQRFRSAEVDRLDNLERSSLRSEEQSEIVKEKLKKYNVELTQVQIELNRLGDTLSQIREIQRNQGDVMSLSELAEDPMLKEQIKTRIQLEQTLEARKVELRPGHPEYERTAGELAKVSQRIQDRVSVVLGTLQNKYNLTKAQEQYMREQIALEEGFSLEVARASSEYNLIKTESDTTKRVFDLINSTVSEVQLGAQLLTNNVSVLDEAMLPPYPVRPRTRVNLLVGALFGLFLGVAAAFFLDYLDNTFRTPDDIEKYLGLSVLGVIPRIREEQGLAHNAVREAYQSLRTSVIFSSKNHRRKVILITSTAPQEGKSSTVSNLARTLAAAGDRVIVVDCDLRRPTQHKIHGLDRDLGVTNYLAAPLDPAIGVPRAAEWMAYTKIGEPATLHILPSGPIPPSPPELLGSERFSDLLAQLREAYDWVLLDSPPAATLADSTLLAALADMSILVVRHNQTDRDLVRKALQRLTAVNATVAGAVMNNVDLDRAYNKDYYYAGAYYMTDDAKQSATRRRGKVESKVNVG